MALCVHRHGFKIGNHAYRVYDQAIKRVSDHIGVNKSLEGRPYLTVDHVVAAITGRGSLSLPLEASSFGTS